MSNVIVVTNRRLSIEPFEKRVARLAVLDIKRIILREKDLNPGEYLTLAKRIIEICKEYDTELLLHTYTELAAELGCNKIHLPVSKLENAKGFDITGASCHSPDDAILAENYQSDYITFGHVFYTDCKRGMKPQGLYNLAEVSKGVNIPVYAIGGISPDNYKSVLKAGASGCCIMSSAMNSDNPEKLIKELNEIEKIYRDERNK